MEARIFYGMTSYEATINEKRIQKAWDDFVETVREEISKNSKAWAGAPEPWVEDVFLAGNGWSFTHKDASEE